MKLIFVAILTLFGIKSIAQSDDIPRLQINLTDDKINYIIKETVSSIENGIQVSFSAQSDFFGNTNSLKKKASPASMAEIAKLKKKLCKCPDDMKTNLEIGTLFNRLYKPDSARLYLGNALGICMEEKLKKPNDRDLQLTEANIYMQAGDYASCVALYEKLLESNPKDTIARIFLTISYLGAGDTAKFDAITKDNFTQMPDELVFAFFRIVGDGYAMIFQGKTIEDKNISLKKFTKLELLKKLPVLNNDSTKINDCHHALIVFNGYLKFILFNGDSTIVKNDLGFLKIGNEDELKATIEYFTQRTKNKKNKNAFMHHKFIAMAHFLLGDFKSSITFLQKSISTFPKDRGDTGDNNPSEQYNNIAATYFMLGDTSMVIKSIENKIAKKPKIDVDPNDYVILGNFYSLTKNEVKAKLNYEAALKINSYQINAHIGLATLEFKNKKYEETMLHLNNAYAINQNEPNIYYINAAIYLLNNQPNEAYQIYSSLYSFFPDDEFLNEVINEFYDY
jgi:tetratricopeptide (TPR) repeat protein